MAYEVTKRIGGRAYLYRVESVRDPESGRRRSRWTYLGRAQPADARRAPAEPPKRRGDARGRLLDALERLLAARDFGDVTADAIAAEAGLAHGTFYRHFRDKRAALLAAMERVRERRGPLTEQLRDDVASEAEARAGLRAMGDAILRAPATNPALLRASFLLALRDPEASRERRERRADGIARIGRHLSALSERGLARVTDPEATAAALLALLDGFYREAILDETPLDERRIAAALDVIERAVFGIASPPALAR
ncbi:MAG TPA: helix-turn-helix domain-containing protein [Candidatus Baltobacteraceae bacterium]|nr:helix-turn-helix domain-containing protein [Candidatus Baltobacteraceae bacterium]